MRAHLLGEEGRVEEGEGEGRRGVRREYEGGKWREEEGREERGEKGGEERKRRVRGEA